MAFDTSWLSTVMPIWAFVLVLIVFYAVLQKTKVLGANKWIDSIVSILIGIIFLTFSSVRDYLVNITPWFAVLLTCVFFFLMIVMFIAKEPDKFFKPMAVVFVILLALIIIIAAFYTFPQSRAILPGNLDNSCSYNADYDYFSYKDCSDKGSYWKCYENSRHTDYTLYDRCSRTGSEYECYDYSGSSSCYSGNSDSNDVFVKMKNWIYRDKITNAFWLIVIAAVAIFAVTRK